MTMSLRAALISVVVCSLASPATAQAQVYFAAYLGGNVTRAATVNISQPGAGTSVDFARVGFDAKPLKSPQYYGLRLGTMTGARRLGLELEFIHLKVIARTAETYVATGQIAGVAVNGPVRMDSLVQRYSMTHGLNFILLNVVSRTPLGSGRAAIVSRIGAGPMVPHTESTVDQLKVEKYEYAGFGAHAASGLDIALKKQVSLVAEYKLTYGRPQITVPSGTGRTTTLTSQIALGLAFGLSR